MIQIPLSRPPVDVDVKQAVLRVIESGQYILGAQCREFEGDLARYVGTRHCILTSSATAGLWLTLRALGVKASDEVLVPSHTAFPTIEAICFADATPVFVDTDRYYTMDPCDAAAKATPRTIGLIPVHLYGQPVDLDALRELAARLGVWLLEDCAQAHGAEWFGKKVGGFGRAAVFSFYPSKNLTVMGDGGAVVTDDDEIAARCRRLRDHGRLNKDVHSEIGFNLRFNEIQAAIGHTQLGRLDMMNDHRRRLAAQYDESLVDLPLGRPEQRPGARHVYHLYVVRTPRRNELAAFLKSRGIQTGIHYSVASHRQPAVERFAAPRLNETERLVNEILTLPLSAGHTTVEIEAVVAAVREYFAA